MKKLPRARRYARRPIVVALSLVYPSPIHAGATLFGSGRGVLDGHANFLAEPYPGFRVLFHLDAVPLDALSLPVRSHTSFVLAGGILAAAGDLETSPAVRNLPLSKLSISGVKLDYVHANAGSAKPRAAAPPTSARTAAKEESAAPSEPEWAIRLDKALISSSEIGFVNREKSPGYPIASWTACRTRHRRRRGDPLPARPFPPPSRRRFPGNSEHTVC